MSSGREQAISRRVFTSAVISAATLGLAGCLKGDGTQLSVYNSRPNPVTIHIEVFHIDSEPKQQVFTDDPTIPPNETQEYKSLFEESGTKRIIVETEDGQQAHYEWGADPDSQSSYLSVRIEEDAIEFSLAIG